MTPEELMKPRYKVIASFPMQSVSVGKILYGESGRVIDFSMMVHYAEHPHLFRELRWWEDRKPEEMPEYLKVKSTKEIFKVSDLVSGVYKNYLMNYLPATKEEYLNQNK